MTDTLHTKYRPKTFKEVIGQDHFLKQLAGIVGDRTAHAFMFAGPSGCGKTTLARICAHELGCQPNDIIEHDGATKNGVEELRTLQELVRYRPLGNGKYRAVILDEAHRITGNAFDSILKIVEEPPEHLFWFFATTAPTKVPNTIRTRCQLFTVRDVHPEPLAGLLQDVCKAEGFKTPKDILSYIATKSNGSPRQALVNLERCADAKSIKEAATLLEQVVDEDVVIELCRFLISGKGKAWTKAMDIVKRAAVNNTNAEGVRIVVLNYLGACLAGAKSDDEAIRVLSLMEPFSQTFHNSEGRPALMLALGRALLT